MFDFKAFERFIQEALDQYDKTAPAAARYLDDLYIRVSQNDPSVRLIEIVTVAGLRDGGTWYQPNYAANYVYKLMSRLGMDTTGLAGF